MFPTIDEAYEGVIQETGQVSGSIAGMTYRTGVLQAAVTKSNAELQQKSMTALEAAMRAFTDASNKGSEALTKATNKLVVATWVLGVVATIQTLVMIIGS